MECQLALSQIILFCLILYQMWLELQLSTGLHCHYAGGGGRKQNGPSHQLSLLPCPSPLQATDHRTRVRGPGGFWKMFIISHVQCYISISILVYECCSTSVSFSFLSPLFLNFRDHFILVPRKESSLNISFWHNVLPET